MSRPICNSLTCCYLPVLPLSTVSESCHTSRHALRLLRLPSSPRSDASRLLGVARSPPTVDGNSTDGAVRRRIQSVTSAVWPWCSSVRVDFRRQRSPQLDGGSNKSIPTSRSWRWARVFTALLRKSLMFARREDVCVIDLVAENNIICSFGSQFFSRLQWPDATSPANEARWLL